MTSIQKYELSKTRNFPKNQILENESTLLKLSLLHNVYLQTWSVSENMNFLKIINTRFTRNKSLGNMEVPLLSFHLPMHVPNIACHMQAWETCWKNNIKFYSGIGMTDP